MALAGPAPAYAGGNAAVEAAVERSVTAWRMIFTCSATLPKSLEVLQRLWTDEVGKSLPLLEEAGYGPADLEDIKRRTEPAAMIDRDRSFGEVIDACAADTDLMRRVQMMRMPLMSREIRKAMAAP